MEKPKIALIVDVYNWAFYNRAIILKEKLSEFYNIKIIPADTALENNILQLILMLQDYDLVHFFWRRILFNLDNEYYIFKRNDINVEEFIKDKFLKIAKTTCIPDHLLLDEENIEKSKKAINFTDNYYVISKKLYNLYSKLEGFKKPYDTIIYNGVEIEKFKPQNLERFQNRENKKLTIGWSGNSKWGGEGYEDIKGARTILIPAVEELKKEGYDIELKLADSSVKLIPHDEMPEYYNQLDLYVCVSKTEGGPNPIMESMSCGIPIISTDVAFVRDIFGEKQQEYILEERSIKCLKEKIKKIYNNQNILNELSKENMGQVQQYDYDNLKWEFKKFFDDTLKKKREENERNGTKN